MESLTLQVDGSITGRAYIQGVHNYFFCLQVDGPITGRAYKRGEGGGGAYKRDFTVYHQMWLPSWISPKLII